MSRSSRTLRVHYSLTKTPLARHHQSTRFVVSPRRVKAIPWDHFDRDLEDELVPGLDRLGLGASLAWKARPRAVA